jgi:hypothetical protein
MGFPAQAFHTHARIAFKSTCCVFHSLNDRVHSGV